MELMEALSTVIIKGTLTADKDNNLKPHIELIGTGFKKGENSIMYGDKDVFVGKSAQIIDKVTSVTSGIDVGGKTRRRRDKKPRSRSASHKYYKRRK
jgi:hypothetical protein